LYILFFILFLCVSNNPLTPFAKEIFIVIFSADNDDAFRDDEEQKKRAKDVGMMEMMEMMEMKLEGM